MHNKITHFCILTLLLLLLILFDAYATSSSLALTLFLFLFKERVNKVDNEDIDDGSHTMECAWEDVDHSNKQYVMYVVLETNHWRKCSATLPL